MAVFVNICLYQLGWFACVFGAANRTILFLVVGGLLLTMDTGCSLRAWKASNGELALRFKVKTLKGEEVDLAKYAGKVVMIVNRLRPDRSPATTP